jgi:hypothetical protein
MWTILAYIALAAIIGTQVLMIQGNPQGFQNQAQYLGAAAGGNFGTSSRGVGTPTRTVSVPVPHR